VLIVAHNLKKIKFFSEIFSVLSFAFWLASTLILTAEETATLPALKQAIYQKLYSPDGE